MWPAFARTAVVALIALAASPGAALAEGTPPFVVTLAGGWGTGIEANSGIDKLELRAGVERRFAPALSAGMELAGVRFAGARGGREADTIGLTALPVVRWHFLRFGQSSAAFEFGFGGARFETGFPPGGTRWNGYSAFGLSLWAAVRPHLAVTAGVRFLHHSNGRGLVSDNPAYDGVSLHAGVALGR